MNLEHLHAKEAKAWTSQALGFDNCHDDFLLESKDDVNDNLKRILPLKASQIEEPNNHGMN
jgi:hypothetical protein